MSGAGKKVVDVAFKASKNIDWDGMAKLIVSKEARKEFSTLRRAFDEVNSTLQTKLSQVQKKTHLFFFLGISVISSLDLSLSFLCFFFLSDALEIVLFCIEGHGFSLIS
jgi:hypothetical protein